jgi:major membrane immunogen (membrane-anchored lipoprotein)
MKKSTAKLFGILTVAASLITGCSSSDNPTPTTPPSSTFTADANNFQGTINDGSVTLDATKVYKLTGKVQVNNGATLTIPAGTIIQGTGGTQAYIAIAQGGKLNVEGTAANPVVMTSGLTNKAAGDWGGVVICGKAPINRINGGAGTAQSEVADLTYGGTVANDNSGSIKYLRIEYAGAAFNSEKEFNGLSLFGVGSGTTIDYVEFFQGADDGVEFFGGTVNTSNLISIGNEDDQFDWTEGWSGTNTNWYGKLGFGKGNRGIEADNFELGYSFTPIANPTITNLTLVGPGSNPTSGTWLENDALKLRRGTKGVFTNLFLSNWKVGFNVENDETIAFIPTGLKAVNVNYTTDVATKTSGKLNAVAPATSGLSTNVAAIVTSEGTSMGAGNGANMPTWAAGWSVGF